MAQAATAAFKIRQATAADASRLVEFNLNLAWESEALRLDPGTLRRGVDRALASPALCRYFVAEQPDGTLIGQTMVTYELTDWRDGLIYWIQSVYVAPDHRGRGVFGALYREVQAAAAAGGGRLVRLYVEQDNQAAIGVYERLGMRRMHFHLYECPVAPAAVTPAMDR